MFVPVFLFIDDFLVLFRFCCVSFVSFRFCFILFRFCCVSFRFVLFLPVSFRFNSVSFLALQSPVFCLGRTLSLTFFLFFSWNIVSTQREIYTQCADAAGILLHGKWTWKIYNGNISKWKHYPDSELNETMIWQAVYGYGATSIDSSSLIRPTIYLRSSSTWSPILQLMDTCFDIHAKYQLHCI